MSYPPIIYKYRNWNLKFHRNILLKNEVFMSPPGDFNDPFDCRIPTNHFLMDTPEKVEQYVMNGIEKHKDWLIKSGRNIDYEISQKKERLADLETYQKEHEEIEFGAMEECFGILSLSGRWDSILMWSHYADFHKGFNLGFNEEKMRNCGLFGKGGSVSYTEDFPVIDPLLEEPIMVTSFKQTHHKAMDWEYEQEYRLMNFYFEGAPTTEERIINVPEEFLEEVNLGMNISTLAKSEIVAECKRRNIRVFQLEKIPFKFELTRVEVEN